MSQNDGEDGDGGSGDADTQSWRDNAASEDIPSGTEVPPDLNGAAQMSPSDNKRKSPGAEVSATEEGRERDGGGKGQGNDEQQAPKRARTERSGKSKTMMTADLYRSMTAMIALILKTKVRNSANCDRRRNMCKIVMSFCLCDLCLGGAVRIVRRGGGLQWVSMGRRGVVVLGTGTFTTRL